ncbi:MAG: zf-HC2 domain-containing protein [Candidatus Solibacter sp.]
MSCEYVQERISLLLDAKLQSGEREHVLAHLETCGKCGSKFESMQYMRDRLRNLARTRMPSPLVTQLRVIASHECARRGARKSLSTRLAHWATATRLAFDNLMRPFAVPVTGGVTSAFVMFSLLVPSLSFPHPTTNDPPLENLISPVPFGDPDGELDGTTHGVLESAGALIYGNEVSLTLLIDERGRVQDFYLSGGKLTDEMKSVILLSRFTPATVNGQPTWGLKQVVYTHQRLRS